MIANMRTKALTDKQKAFVTHYSELGNATHAAIRAGYSKETAENQGYQLKKRLSEEINIATRDVLAGAAPVAVDKLKSLVTDDSVPKAVQLGAINSILDRTGHQKITEVQLSTGFSDALKTVNERLLNMPEVIEHEDIDISADD